MKINSVCILGGTGFVGTQLASQLVKQGKSVRLLTRNRDNHKHLLVLPGLELIDADIFDGDQLRKHFSGMDAVINLVGILNEKQHNGDGFRRAHVELPRLILNECLSQGIDRILQMSALNADANKGQSHYLRSKGEGENTLHTFSTEKLHVTSFRPSVIFGPGDSFFNRFAGLLKITPLIFPLACANTLFAPVYVGDVARRFVLALEDKSSYGQRYDLCGPKQYSLKQLVEYTATQLELKRVIIGLPDFLSHLQALLLEWAPGKPFSVDNYNSLKTDSICVQGGSETTSIESIVPYYIGSKGMNMRYDEYRSRARR